MAEELHKFLKDFDQEQHLLGCVGHVFNLAAKGGLKTIVSESQELIVFDFPESDLGKLKIKIQFQSIFSW